MNQPAPTSTPIYVIGVVDDEPADLKAIVGKLVSLDDEYAPVVVKEATDYEELKRKLDEFKAHSEEKGTDWKIALFVVDRNSENPAERDFGHQTLKCIHADYPDAYRIYYSNRHSEEDIGASVKDRTLADVAMSKTPDHQNLLREVTKQIKPFRDSVTVDHMDALFINSLKDMERLHRIQKPGGGALKIHMQDGDYTVEQILSRRDLSARILSLLVLGLASATTLKPVNKEKS